MLVGAEKVAEVLLFVTSEPELPFASDQFTGLFEVNVTMPFSRAEVAEGVIIRPPLVITATPVPVRLTVVGEPGWLPVTTTEAVSAATREGLNDTDKTQLAPEGTVLPQLWERRKSLALPPAIEIEESER